MCIRDRDRTLYMGAIAFTLSLFCMSVGGFLIIKNYTEVDRPVGAFFVAVSFWWLIVGALFETNVFS